MKNQRMKTEVRSFRASALALVLVMLATLFCCFTVMASAATTKLQVELADLDFSALQQDASGNYYKVYDGTTDATVSLKDDADIGIAAGDDVTVEVTAAFNSKNVLEAKNIVLSFTLSGTDAAKYQAPGDLYIGAGIQPKELTWSAAGSASTVFVPNQSSYTGITVDTRPTLDTTGIIGTDAVTLPATVPTVTLNGVTGAGTGYTTELSIGLDGADKANYTIGKAEITVEVTKLQIVEVQWNVPAASFEWGDANANNIEAWGYDAEGRSCQLIVNFPADYGTAKEHVLTASLEDTANTEFSNDNAANTTQKIVITPKVFTVGMENAIYVGNEGSQTEPDVFHLAVSGNLPAEILAQIVYTLDGAAFNGTSAYGVHTVKATLPTSDNYSFVDADGEAVTELEADLIINRRYIHAGTTSETDYEIVLENENGLAGSIAMSVANVEKSALGKAIRGFRVFKGYTLKVTGAEGESYAVLIPVSDELLTNKNKDLVAGDLYIYEALNDKLVKISDKGYTVTFDGSHYRIDGLSGNIDITLVIAPESVVSFWLTAPGIALLIFLILALLLILLLIGLYLHRIRRTEENEVLIVDTEGDVPAVVPAVIEDKVDEEAFLEETAEKIAESIEGETEEAPADAEAVEEAVAESMQALAEEAAAIELDEDPTEELLDEKAEELQETVEAEDAEAEADEDALRDAVAAAMEDINASADASDAVAVVEEDEMSFEDFKAVVDAIVNDAMLRTMEIEELAAEIVEEESEETAEAEEETVEVAEDETVVEEESEEIVEAEEETEEVVIEELSNEDICAVVADSVAEAFELVTVDGVTPKAVEGTTLESITDAVKASAYDNIPDSWNKELSDEVTGAITEELAARLLVEEEPVVEEEPAVEAFAAVAEPVAETDEDDDNDDDDDAEEEEDYGDYGSMPLTFIDAMAEAEKYAVMLEEERRGEVHIVTRYRRSFQSRLIQSQGNVQDYYTILKNTLLSYKGIKNRISWNYEAFNRGRVHVAKMNAKTKTLYLYLALNPEELVDTKYGIVDVSSKKKYATVPVLMKIKGERKFKYALELIQKLCAEDLALPLKKEPEEVDYHEPYRTTEELVQEGVVKKMVASVPVAAYGETPAEEVTTDSSAAVEEQDVTFIEPTTVAAVEEAAEEVAAEEAAAAEAPAEETAAEEIPADAEASDEEPKEV